MSLVRALSHIYHEQISQQQDQDTAVILVVVVLVVSVVMMMRAVIICTLSHDCSTVSNHCVYA
jgi:hypothetical protein